MKNKIITAFMVLTFAAGTITGCGGSTQTTDSSTEETAETSENTEEAAAEGEEAAADGQAAEETKEYPEDAYLSGIKADDYVDLPADYASMTVEVAAPAEVTDEDVNTDIANTLESHQELVEIEGRDVIEEGDVVNIDYVGRFKDTNEEFEGGSAQGFDLEIGSGTFIPGFEEGLIDEEVGTEIDLDLTFPEDYPTEALAGKETVFTVNINKIQEYHVPDFTDEFVAGLGEKDFGNVISTADDYRAYVKKEIIKQREEQYTSERKSAIITKLMDGSTFKQDVPEAMVSRYYDMMTNYYTQMASGYGMELTQLIDLIGPQIGTTSDTYEADFRERCVSDVKQDIVMQAISDKEGLTPTDEEFQTELEKAVENSRAYSSVDDLDKETRESYREYLMGNKVLDFLVSKTTVKDPSGEGDGEQETEEGEDTEESAE